MAQITGQEVFIRNNRFGRLRWTVHFDGQPALGMAVAGDLCGIGLWQLSRDASFDFAATPVDGQIT